MVKQAEAVAMALVGILMQLDEESCITVTTRNFDEAVDISAKLKMLSLLLSPNRQSKKFTTTTLKQAADGYIITLKAAIVKGGM